MSWRDELIETVKSKAERQAEEDERKKKRLEAALEVAGEALSRGKDSLGFANEQLSLQNQPVTLDQAESGATLVLGELKVQVGLDRETAILSVSFNEGRPREFDFANDRHLSPKDVEEYVGRRALELARAAQKANPW